LIFISINSRESAILQWLLSRFEGLHVHNSHKPNHEIRVYPNKHAPVFSRILILFPKQKRVKMKYLSE